MSVEQVLNMQSESEELSCRVCAQPGGDKCILCDACRQAYHFECVGIDDSVVNREWFCQACIAKTTEAKSSSPIDPRQQDQAMKEISRLFEEMKACMEQRSDTPRQSRSVRVCYSCNRPETSEMIACQKCDRQTHFICLPMGFSKSERNTWLCAFCKLKRMESANTIDVVLARLEAMEKMEGQAMASVPRASYGIPLASSTAWGQSSTEELTRIQRSARQAVTGKLPPFSGNPEEWAMFIASYEETTRLCGYTDGENILRLQLALKGKALKAVQCRLRHAENLPEIMETLKAMYGRPEIVINTLLEQVQRMPLPKTDNLETLVDYGIAVEVICATLRSSCSESRFDGPLLQELVGRLPGIVKLMWGMHIRGQLAPTLADFGKWMRDTKDAALLVTPPSTKRDEKKPTKQVNVHTPVRHTYPSTATCACDDRCRQLDCCDKFLKMAAAERWKHVRTSRFCSGCLRRHRNECRDKRTCGKNGCTLKHHPLLHDNSATPEAENSKYLSNLSHSTISQPDVLLRYVPVTLHGRGKSVDTVALLDEGSTVTLMKHRMMKELGLEGSSKPLCLSWTGGQVREETDSMQTNLYISGRRANDHRYEISAVRTIRSLGLPPQSISAKKLGEKYSHLSVLPIPSFDSAVPRILIGIDKYHLTRPLRTIEGPSNEPVATKTRLGWVVSGCCRLNGHGTNERVFTHGISACECQNIEERIDKALKGSFALEDGRSSNEKAFLSKANERALEILNNQTHRVGERWSKMQRTMAYVWRFVNNARSPIVRQEGPLARSELQAAEHTIIRELQQQAFDEEYRILREARDDPDRAIQLNRQSPLFKRSPYMDGNGLLR
uniref:PHD-type domain-containing protein n=1 Tax=Anopheles funestus TaxID=62324 RepID=A0A182RWX5_ANOFN